jgi:hypothetical protein
MGEEGVGVGSWGLGIGDWGLGVGVLCSCEAYGMRPTYVEKHLMEIGVHAGKKVSERQWACDVRADRDEGGSEKKRMPGCRTHPRSLVDAVWDGPHQGALHGLQDPAQRHSMESTQLEVRRTCGPGLASLPTTIGAPRRASLSTTIRELWPCQLVNHYQRALSQHQRT